MNLTRELIPNVEKFRERHLAKAEWAARVLVGGLALNHFLIFCYSLWLIRTSGKPGSDFSTSYNWFAGFWAVALFGMVVWACFRKSGKWYLQRITGQTLYSGLSIQAFQHWTKEYGIVRAYPIWHFASLVTLLLLLALVAIPLDLTFSELAKQRSEEAIS